MASEGRFTFNQIFDYLRSGAYPDGFDKRDKRSLRKRADFFFVREAKLYYNGGKCVTLVVAVFSLYHFCQRKWKVRGAVGC